MIVAIACSTVTVAAVAAVAAVAGATIVLTRLLSLRRQQGILSQVGLDLRSNGSSGGSDHCLLSAGCPLSYCARRLINSQHVWLGLSIPRSSMQM